MAEPIRILHLFMNMGQSGVPVMLMNYYRHINRKKVQFDFAVEADEEAYFDREIESLGGRVHRIGANSKKPAYYLRLSRIIRDNGYDMVHAHFNFMNLPLLFWVLLHGVKHRVSHSHNSYFFKGFFQKPLRKVMSFLISSMSTELMACSWKAGEALYGKRQMEKGNVKIITNAMELEQYAFDPEKRMVARARLGLEGKTVIGHVGNFIPHKNHGFLIDIFKEIHRLNPDSKLVLVGGGRLMEKTKEKVKAFGLEDSVLLLGKREDVRELYCAFDLFLFPSLYEGLALVLIEAQASGLRCLVSDDIPSEAFVTELATGIPLQDGAEVWAARALELAGESYGRRSRTAEIAEKGFDISANAEILQNIYLDMKG